MDLDKAIGKHTEWKIKLRGAISNQESLDAVTIAKDNCCELGQWLHGEAKQQYQQFAAYSNCIKAHATFHQEAGKVATMINQKKFAEAEAMLGIGSPFSKASSEVGVAITQLKKAVKN